jgi:hypothetical protein
MNHILKAICLFLFCGMAIIHAQPARYMDLCTKGDDYATAFRTTVNGIEVWLNSSNGMKNPRSRRMVRSLCGNTSVGKLDALPWPVNQKEENDLRVYLDGSPTFPYCDTSYGVFASNRLHNGENLDNDLYELRYQNNQWNIRRIDELCSPYWDDSPTLSKDGNLLFFATTRDNPGTGLTNIYYSIRAGESWSAPQPLSDVNTLNFKEEAPFLGPDGFLYFSTNRDGDLDIYRIKIDPQTGRTFPPELPVPFQGVNQKGSNEALPCLSAGGTWLIFSSDRKADGKNTDDYDVWSIRINDAVDTIPITAMARTRTFNESFAEWEDQMLPCATALYVTDRYTGQKYTFPLDKNGTTRIIIPRSRENDFCSDFRYRELIIKAEPPTVQGKEFISETDTLLFDVFSEKVYKHTVYIWDKAIPEDKECVQNFPVTEVQFFLTCYWCPTSLQYADYLPCQSVFRDTVCTKLEYQIPETKCQDGDIYKYQLNFTPPTVSTLRNNGLCIPASELNDTKRKEEWAVKVDNAVDKFVENMKSALQRPCVQKAIRSGKQVTVEVIGWTDPRGIDPICLYTGQEIDFNNTFIKLAGLEKKKSFLPGGILKKNTSFRKSGAEGNELLSDVRAYYTALLLDSLWTEKVPEYARLKSAGNGQLTVTAIGKGIKQELKSNEFRRSANVIVRTPSEISKPDPYKAVTGQYITLTGPPCAVLYNRVIAAPSSVGQDIIKESVSPSQAENQSAPARGSTQNTSIIQKKSEAVPEKKSLSQNHQEQTPTNAAQPPKAESAAKAEQKSKQMDNVIVENIRSTQKQISENKKERGSSCIVVLYGQYTSEAQARTLINQIGGDKAGISVYYDAMNNKFYRVVSPCHTDKNAAATTLLSAKDNLSKLANPFKPMILLTADQDLPATNARWTVTLRNVVIDGSSDFGPAITTFLQKSTEFQYMEKDSYTAVSKLQNWIQKTTVILYYSEKARQAAENLALELRAVTGLPFSVLRGEMPISKEKKQSDRAESLVIHIVQ